MEDTAPQTTPNSSSSKTIMILGTLVVILVLGGAGYMVMGKYLTPSVSAPTMAPKASPTATSVISSIQDALSKSLSLKCDFSDEKTGQKTIAYMKAGSIRSDIMGKTKEENSSVILKDKKMYMWTGKQGMTMAFDMNEMMKDLPSGTPKAPGTSQAPNGAQMMEQLEKFKEKCQPAAVDDALFVPPSDVVFQDLSKMMPSGMKLPSAMPTGVSKEQMEQMQKEIMQKYATTPPAGN